MGDLWRGFDLNPTHWRMQIIQVLRHCIFSLLEVPWQTKVYLYFPCILLFGVYCHRKKFRKAGSLEK